MLAGVEEELVIELEREKCKIIFYCNLKAISLAMYKHRTLHKSERDSIIKITNNGKLQFELYTRFNLVYHLNDK